MKSLCAKCIATKYRDICSGLIIRKIIYKFKRVER